MRKERILIAVSLLAALAGQKLKAERSPERLKTLHKNHWKHSLATLVRAKDTGIVKVELTDKTGFYQFSAVNKGAYRVILTGSGYSRKFSKLVEVTDEKPEHDLGSVAVSAEAKDMKEVTIVARKPFIEQKIDKMVVNVETPSLLPLRSTLVQMRWAICPFRQLQATVMFMYCG